MLENQDTIAISHLAVERAMDDLRRQIGIKIRQVNGGFLAAYPAECLTETLLLQLRALPQNRLLLLLSGARARSIGLTSENHSAVELAANTLSLAQIQALCDPVAPEAMQHLQPVVAADPLREGLVKLAKYTALLPALLVVEGDGTLETAAAIAHWQTLAADDIARYVASPLLEVIETSHAALPLEGVNQSTLISFRTRFATPVHLALVIGNLSPEPPPLVRIHSSCVTGDILGSLRCDCGDQLRLALDQIKAAGSGLLLYLHQEGRGIGIANKLRAYQLQDQGCDTYDANLALGFEEDERDFGIASAIIKHLGLRRIRLLTNNPHKITALEADGISVSERVPLIIKAGSHNHAYLDAKAKKSGHLF